MPENDPTLTLTDNVLAVLEGLNALITNPADGDDDDLRTYIEDCKSTAKTLSLLVNALTLTDVKMDMLGVENKPRSSKSLALDIASRQDTGR